MYRNLLRVPLQQALVLLWLVGIVQLLLRLEEHHLTFGWAFSAGLGALVAALLAAHFRALQLLPISTLLGLGALLTTLYQLDLNDSAGLAFASALYALLLWGFVVYTLSRPATLQLVEILCLRGGYGEAGGRALAEQTTHWSAFAIIVACAVLLVTQSPFLVLGSQPPTDHRVLWPMNDGASLIALSALATGGIFLLLTGQRYRLILHSYVLLVLV